jgi:hypothetical protein
MTRTIKTDPDMIAVYLLTQHDPNPAYPQVATLALQSGLIPREMKLSASLGLTSDLRAAFCIATLPTLKAICCKPSLIIRPTALSRTFMAVIWDAFAAPTDKSTHPTKLALILPHARGAMLDIGAGHASGKHKVAA